MRNLKAFRSRSLLALTLVAAVLTVPSAGPAAAADACAPLLNPVACENTKPGTPRSTWDVSGAGSAALQGFATQMSVNVGETVNFKIKSTATSYRLDVYRMGWYGGNGARLVATVNPVGRQTQPACLSNSGTGLVDCGNWAVSASWAVPAAAVSGIYFARLVRTDGTAGASHVVFVVRDDASHSDLLFQTSDTTWQAYNSYGGNSLYTGSPAGRAYKVSYNRPLTTRGTGAEDAVFNAEYPMVRFLEANGYDVSYSSGVDTDARGALLRNHKSFLSVGHDEYWSGGQRANVEAARDAGVSLAFFSGNEVFWKTRWENAIDGSGTAYRTLVCYKETLANAKTDPTSAWTGTWRDPRFSPPADGGRPENGLTGTIFKVNSGTVNLQVPAADGKMRFWRGTTVATQAAGATATLGAGIVGYEWDEDADNGARPRGLIGLSTTTATGVDVLQDYGSTYASGSATHRLTLYRAASGALVFGAGTVQWSWGLDSDHDRGSGAASAPMRQATVNLFADMGAQPATLQSGLTAATASTDTVGPAATVTAPAAGASVSAGAPVTIAGTAADSGGGVVGGVEVSTDNGATWHPATGRAAWTYVWTPGGSGATTVRVRATDDSANVGADATVAVTVGARSCPCTIWDAGATPAIPADPDGTGTEVGTKFRADVAGQVTAIRFYKGSANTGTHVGHLWTAAGTQLAAVTFSGESATGWQQANLSSPVALTAGTTYVVSYYAPNGRYAADPGYFATQGVDSEPLHALRDGIDGVNGVYRFGTGYPTLAWESANYWVDVVFAPGGGTPDSTAPTVTARTPAAGATGVAAATTATATFSEAVQSSTVALVLKNAGGATVPASVAYDAATRKATLTPTAVLAASTTYTVTASGAADLAGNVMAAASWSFTTAAGSTPPTGCPCSVWATSVVPGTPAESDTAAVEVGMKFRADAAGQVTAVRFYKGSGNTGTHVGHLWSSTGTLLGTVTFSGETATGWQTATFATPVPVAADTTYVVSYYAPVGRYAGDSGYFAAGVDNGPLHALRDGVDGPNGVYRYGTGGGFPSNTWESTNYWVDVMFTPSN
ncbi:N,N-dimethylformamidase beta subunit family domain-containing protein [Actinoplanes sp. ATCC 53533]|uniref:N,N-dimethylformamidase beta subunit family domain-containing protein n=1 Tax=Actinoplanes sp. ATCC 53533 TaxID=1288362 RepID=UPI0018F5909E|nr:N,N-dimethylformamidase beta subunit family domain-containing protein [Actinoplanes sp. ATCC 53533]